ncbi:hypothetical protein ACHAW5_004453 [Stephanodiscus triporus]|uniref:Uncharacterized protein n=1 Tax=Stephanodiscus triporus TaxID=2934178 RepID=A0ABD3QBM2_9STRA
MEIPASMVCRYHTLCCSTISTTERKGVLGNTSAGLTSIERAITAAATCHESCEANARPHPCLPCHRRVEATQRLEANVDSLAGHEHTTNPGTSSNIR